MVSLRCASHIVVRGATSAGHDGKTPFGPLWLGTLHRQGVEVSLISKDVALVVEDVPPHKVSTVINRIELGVAAGAGDGRSNPRGINLGVVDEADFIRGRDVSGVDDRLLTAGSRRCDVVGNTNELSTREGVTRTLKVRDIDEVHVAPCRTERRKQGVRSAGETQVLTDVRILFLQVVDRLRGGNQSELFLPVDFSVVPFRRVTRQLG